MFPVCERSGFMTFHQNQTVNVIPVKNNNKTVTTIHNKNVVLSPDRTSSYSFHENGSLKEFKLEKDTVLLSENGNELLCKKSSTVYLNKDEFVEDCY